MESLQHISVMWLVHNLEQLPVALLSRNLPTRLKIKLLLNLPVVDICKLERTTFASDIHMDVIWKRCLQVCGELKSIPSKLRKSWTPKETYFNKLCSVAVNFDLQLEGHRSDEARNICKRFLFLAADRSQSLSVPHMGSTPSRYGAIKLTNTSLMQCITTECGYFPKVLIFTHALKLLPQGVVLEAFVSQVEHVIFNPNPFKYNVFPSFCAYIIEKLFNKSLSLLHYIEFINCEVMTWNCILHLLSINDTSTSDDVLVLKGIAIVHDEQVDHQDVETVADIVASVLNFQDKLEVFYISNWHFSTYGRRTAKLLSAIGRLFNQPDLKALNITNTALNQGYVQSIVLSFLFCNTSANQCLCLSNIDILEDHTIQASFYPPNHDFSTKTLCLNCVDLHILQPFLLQYSQLRFQSLSLTSPKELSESVISDVLNHYCIESKEVNLSGVNFSLLANPGACIASVFCSTVLLELCLDFCSLIEGNVLSHVASNLPQALSLYLLSVRCNHLGHASDHDIKLFFASICKLPQLQHLDLDMSSNLLKFSHLKFFRDALVDAGREYCLKKLTVMEIVAETEVKDEVLHNALFDILEDLSVEHEYSVISNNCLSADHIANM